VLSVLWLLRSHLWRMAELKKLHRDRKDRSAGRLRERRKELAHVLRTAFGGSGGGRAHTRA